jgi:hypothetical protein
MLVESYVSHTLWYAYWNHRDNVNVFSNWKNVRQTLLTAAATSSSGTLWKG